jgi:hypothetical protein
MGHPGAWEKGAAVDGVFELCGVFEGAESVVVLTEDGK